MIFDPHRTGPAAESAYAFRHAVQRDAAYQLQIPSTRGILHRIALEVLEGLASGVEREAVSQEMADHAREAARTAEGAEAKEFARRELAYLQVAGGFASRQFRNLDAAVIWKRVSAHVEATPEDAILAAIFESEVWSRIGDASRALVALDGASTRLEGLRSAGGAGPALRKLEGRIDLARGSALAPTARQEECIAHLERAVSALEAAGDSAGHVRALVGLARQLDTGGRKDEAAATAQRAIAVADSAGDQNALAVARCSLAAVTSDALLPEERLELFEQARKSLDRADVTARVQLLNGLGMLHHALGDPAGEGEVLAALDQAVQAGARQAEAMVRSNLGMLRMESGRPQEALEAYELALIAARESGSAIDEARVLGNLANLLVSLHRVDEAESCFREALDILRRVKVPTLEGNILGNYAPLLELKGRFDEAADCYARCRQILLRSGDTVLEGVYAGLQSLLSLLVSGATAARRDAERACAAVRREDFASWRVEFALAARHRVELEDAESSGGSLEPARASLEEMRAIVARQGFAPGSVAAAALASSERLHGEVEASRRDGRASEVFRGRFIRELPAVQRHALLALLADRDPLLLARLPAPTLAGLRNGAST